MAVAALVIGICSAVVWLSSTFLLFSLVGSICSLILSGVSLAGAIVCIVLAVKGKVLSVTTGRGVLSVTTGRGSGYSIAGISLGIAVASLSVLMISISSASIVIHTMLEDPTSKLNILLKMWESL